MVFYIGSTVLLFLSIYCWLGIRHAYCRGNTLPWHVSATIWMLDTLHLALVSLASADGVWEIQFNRIGGLTSGIVFIGAGFTVLIVGMITFRSFRRISGMYSSNLLTKGIYRWSRNPQYVGWFICLLGISLVGRSGLAFLLTALLIVGIHLYNVLLEEPNLECVFEEEYREYKSGTARYFGIPRT